MLCQKICRANATDANVAATIANVAGANGTDAVDVYGFFESIWPEVWSVVDSLV